MRTAFHSFHVLSIDKKLSISIGFRLVCYFNIGHNIPGLVFSNIPSLIEICCSQGSYQTRIISDRNVSSLRSLYGRHHELIYFISGHDVVSLFLN